MKNKQQKQREGYQRRIAYESLTPLQKLQKLDEGGYRAARVRKKLQKLLEASKDVKESIKPGESKKDSAENVDQSTKARKGPKHQRQRSNAPAEDGKGKQS